MAVLTALVVIVMGLIRTVSAFDGNDYGGDRDNPDTKKAHIIYNVMGKDT